MGAEIPPPGEHGDDARRIARALGRDPKKVLDLATSLNPVAPDVRLLVATTLDSLRSYPDPADATAALAEAMGADPASLLLTNGGAEAIALVAAELGGGWVDEPDFALYRRHLSTLDPAGPRWRSNPHNPTGRLARGDERAGVWDEAFYALATGEWTRGDVSANGAIVVGSLTKLFACPGLRLGYALCPDEQTAARLAARQPRWSVSGPALAALPKMLETADLPEWHRQVAVLREDLVAVLRSAGLEPEPSDANFVLVRRAGDLRARLAAEGVVVRDCASFGMPGTIRVAVPDERGLATLERALVDALDDAAGRGGSGESGRRGLSRPNRGAAQRPRGALLVCGTSSDAGKSQIVTGLCRLLARRGVKVAPFKAQNMSLNSFATPSGHEIGRAQGIQAIAAGIEPEVAMNPILLKPTGHATSQVVVMGEPLAELGARDYQASKRAALMPVVLEALASLRARHDLVICEGAGSPAEINLLDGDLANLGLAEAAGIPAVLVGDIERGGVFASIAGTFSVLPDEMAVHLRAFVINKFRGDPSLLDAGIDAIGALTGRPCAGVVPYLEGLRLDAEDSLGLAPLVSAEGARPTAEATLDVVVVDLPHLANFTDLDALATEPDVSLRLVASPAQWGAPDLVLLPGSKSTVADLAWLRQTGLASRILAAATDPEGPTILGICAGYQMLGEAVVDEYESRAGRVEALGLLPVVTTFTPEKRTRPRTARTVHPRRPARITGYEIRQGVPAPRADDAGRAPQPFLLLDDEFGTGPDGCERDDGRVAGTNLHGLFESDDFRAAYLADIAAGRRRDWRPSGVSFSARREQQIDRIADALEEHLDIELLLAIAASASASGATA
jgi:cobyric acid synthase CobQ